MTTGGKHRPMAPMLLFFILAAFTASFVPRATAALQASTPRGVHMDKATVDVATPVELQLETAVSTTLRQNIRYYPLAILPSPAYSSPYLRDSFWATQTYNQRSFSLSILNRFASAERKDGDPPTFFVTPYQHPTYHDDESASLLLIWAYRAQTLYGQSAPRVELQKDLTYLLGRVFHGYVVSPAGSYRSWWDSYVAPTEATQSYNQGLYVVALRSAKALGLTLPKHSITLAEQAYRSLYNPTLGYLPQSTTLPATDSSALTGEFLSMWLFHRPILTDVMVRHTVTTLPQFDAGYRVVALPGGVAFPTTASMGKPGDYQNGGSWLLYDALSIASAGLHGAPNMVEKLQARLALEFRHEATLHEYLQTDPSLPYYGSEPPFRNRFSWDMFVLVIDQYLRQMGIS